MSRPDSWDTDHLDAFLAAVSDTRLEAAWHLLAFTPIRIRELLALRWADVDTFGARISIRDAVAGVPYAALAVPPGHLATRTVLLEPAHTTVLDRHHERQQAEHTEWGGCYADNDLVVCRENGWPLRRRDLDRAFRQVAERASLGSVGRQALNCGGRFAVSRRGVS